MSREEDPKAAAKQELQRRDVQQDLRQFLKLETGLGNSKRFIKGWERHHTPDIKLDPPLRCSSEDCAYVAETRKEAEWHVEQCPGHTFTLPGKER
jgi:ribosomal protein L44E